MAGPAATEPAPPLRGVRRVPARMNTLDELNGFAGEVVRPDDPGYDAARVVWNGMIDRRPALIVRPTGSESTSVLV